MVEMEGGDEGRVCDGVEMEEGRGGTHVMLAISG